MFMNVRMCECIVCMKEKLIKEKRVASGHQTLKKKKNKKKKCLVPIYVFPEMKQLFPNPNYNVRCPISYTYIRVSVRDLYISILLQEICGPIL
jgi:hypothetical protein